MNKELPYIEQKSEEKLPEVDFSSLKTGMQTCVETTMQGLLKRFNELAEISKQKALPEGDEEKVLVDPGVYLGSGGAILAFLKYIQLLEKDKNNDDKVNEAKKTIDQILEANK